MSTDSGLRKNTLGLFSLVFFVVAAASPLTGVVGGLPIAIISGNGAGIPVFYLLSCVILMLFAVGFIAMSRYVNNAGAFYTYISTGIGENWGGAASVVALIAYLSIQIAIVAMLGYFMQLFFMEHLALDIPWWVLSMGFLLLIWMLSIKRVEVGGKLLGILMLAEVAIILLTDFRLLSKISGPLNFHSFEPSVFMKGNLGIAFIFTIAAFVGFESTAIYAEECRNPKKTIPRATVCALLLITIFFCFTSWSLMQALSADEIVSVIRKNPGDFIFMITRQYVGEWAVQVMSVLLITSLFAAALAFHNNISRYLFSISRDGLIWKALCKTHPVNGTPHNASHVHSIIMLILLAGMGIMSLDPMVQIFAFGSAIATLCILVLQLGVSVAVVIFFRRTRTGDSQFAVLWAPLLSMISMSVTIIMVVNNLQSLSGTQSNGIKMIPWLITALAVAGYFMSHKKSLKVRA